MYVDCVYLLDPDEELTGEQLQYALDRFRYKFGYGCEVDMLIENTPVSEQLQYRTIVVWSNTWRSNDR